MPRVVRAESIVYPKEEGPGGEGLAKVLESSRQGIVKSQLPGVGSIHLCICGQEMFGNPISLMALTSLVVCIFEYLYILLSFFIYKMTA